MENFQKEINDHYAMLAAIQDVIVNEVKEAGATIKNVGHLAGNILIMDFNVINYPKAKAAVEAMQVDTTHAVSKANRVTFYDDKHRIAIIL